MNLASVVGFGRHVGGHTFTSALESKATSNLHSEPSSSSWTVEITDDSTGADSWSPGSDISGSAKARKLLLIACGRRGILRNLAVVSGCSPLVAVVKECLSRHPVTLKFTFPTNKRVWLYKARLRFSCKTHQSSSGDSKTQDHQFILRFQIPLCFSVLQLLKNPNGFLHH